VDAKKIVGRTHFDQFGGFISVEIVALFDSLWQQRLAETVKSYQSKTGIKYPHTKLWLRAGLHSMR